MDGALPRTQPGCSPHPCLQCQHLREPCRTRTRPDMCFHLAQTMTRPMLGCERMRLSLDVDLSPVPRADLALAPARGLGIVQHPAKGTQDAFAAHTGCQLATVHDSHSTITCASLGSLSWPHSPSWPSTGSSTAPVMAPGLCQWLSLLPGPFSSSGLKHPWAPALSTALPSEQQHHCLRPLDQQESCCC